MQDELFDLRMKISKYEDILREIASASEQANPKYLIDRAKMTLSFYAEEDKEPTTADEFNAPHGSAMEESDYDEFNVPVITGDKDTDALLEDERISQDENLKSQQDMLDRHRDMEAQLAEYDKKQSEEAESAWRDTVLHPDYKSEYEEEE